MVVPTESPSFEGAGMHRRTRPSSGIEQAHAVLFRTLLQAQSRFFEHEKSPKNEENSSGADAKF